MELRNRHSRWALKPSLLVALLAAALMAFPALAFKPTKEFGHVGIVSDGITPITRPSSSGGTLQFTDRAICQIRDATAGVDEIFSDRGEFSVPAAHCDDELLPACSQRILDVETAILDNLRDAANRDGEEARAQLGRALHTLQDFYSHSNWVNSPGPGHTSFDPDLGRTTVPRLGPTVATCVDDFLDRTLTGAGLTSITTGYFGSVEPPPGKCAHGVLPGAGIHKDQPGRPFHTEARARAVEGTRDFVELILDSLGGDEDAIREFMDVRGTLGFVIDDTGSMGPEIAGVRTSVARIVTRVAGTDDEPDKYLLQRFNDPSVPGPFVTKDATALLAAVNAIFPSGGGDCPELGQTGLLSALAKSTWKSKLYYYSDASSKDASLAGNVAAAANKKRIAINYILTGSCSPVDPAYLRVAESTGGQVFFIPASQTDRIFNLIEPSLAGDLQPMLVVRDALAGGLRHYELPVDSTATRLTLSVSLDSIGSVRLLRPTGEVVVDADPDAAVTALTSGQIITVESPAPGSWSLDVSGSGDLFVSAFVNSPIELFDVRFVELRGRPEHQGLFPIAGQPVLGDPQVVRAVLFGPYAEAEFDLRAPDGSLIGPAGLSLGGHPEAPADEFSGDFSLPSGPFRFYAAGTDDAGFPFLRAFPARFLAQTVRVTALDGGARLQPGETTPVRFQVDNLGPAATFLLTAADDARFVTAVAPSSLAIPAGASSTFTVSLTTPADTTREFDVLTVVARSSGNPDLANSAVQGLMVGTADGDGDGVPDDTDSCPQSDLTPTVVIDGCDSGVSNFLFEDGCTLSDRIAALAATATNHGQFVSAVSDLTNQLRDAGLISGRDKGAIMSCAAQANIP